ncbi:MAG: diguanylate cyclase domain-containing protein [Methylocystaceae bacterium]
MTGENEQNRWRGLLSGQLLKNKEKSEYTLPPDPINEAVYRLMKRQRIIVYGLGNDRELLYLEGAVEEITGYSQEMFLKQGMSWRDLVFPEDQGKYTDSLLHSNMPDAIPREHRILTRGGQVCWLSDTRIRLAKPINGVVFQGLLVDITEQKQSKLKNLQHQAQLDSILNSVQNVIWSVTPDTFTLVYVNPATKKVYGYKPEDLLAGKYPEFLELQAAMILEHFTDLLYKGEFETVYSFTRPDGEQCWLNKRAYFARDAYGIVARIDGIDTDITIRKKAQDELRYMSEHDPLTNLYNRAYFEQEISRLDQEKERMAGLIICDVDGLKTINDNWGHEAGDKLLIQCSAILRACFPHHTIARIGGDEFAVIMENSMFEEVASAVTGINRALLLYNRSQPKMPVSLSVGWSVRSQGCSRMYEVFREADNRMYAGKSGNRVKFLRMFEEVNKGTE